MLRISDYFGCTFIGLLASLAGGIFILAMVMIFSITGWAPDFLLDFCAVARWCARGVFICWPLAAIYFIRKETRA